MYKMYVKNNIKYICLRINICSMTIITKCCKLFMCKGLIETAF